MSERGGREGEGGHVNMRLIMTQEGDPSQSHPMLLHLPAEPPCLIHKAPTSPEKGLHNAVTNDDRRSSGPSSHPTPVFEGLKGVNITRLLPRPPPHSSATELFHRGAGSGPKMPCVSQKGKPVSMLLHHSLAQQLRIAPSSCLSGRTEPSCQQ